MASAVDTAVPFEYSQRPPLSSFPSSFSSSPRLASSPMLSHSPQPRPSRSPQPQTLPSQPPPPSSLPPPIPASSSGAADTDRTSDPGSKSTKAASIGTGMSSSQHSSLTGGVGAGSGSGAGGRRLASSHQHHPHHTGAYSPRKLRPQYPRGSAENHVEYILAASFDVDEGPIMEHQYPVPITGNEQMLAGLMLPDQTHLRNQDWTMFFLHKDISPEEEDQERQAREHRQYRRARQRQRQRQRGSAGDGMAASQSDDGVGSSGSGVDGVPDSGVDENGLSHENGPMPSDAGADADAGDDYLDYTDDDDPDDESFSTDSESENGEGSPLIYVLNLVNTKQDKTRRRGANVKSMAICTRHPFLHIYKPLLLLALEEYFKSPVQETLALLYDAVNAMDLSLMPRLSRLERNLLQGSENKDLFMEKFEQMIQMRMAEEAGAGAVTRTGTRDSEAEQKQQQQHPVMGISRSGTKAHLEGQSVYSVPRDTHEFESKVYYKGIPIPIKVPVAVMPEIVGDFSLIKLIQTFSEPHAKSPQPFTPHAHLTTNGPHTHPIIVLVNALLTQKRIIFMGHNMPSGEVAEAVLAACALASGGVLRGFTRHAFPYTDLSTIEALLLVPGFIAGVTNPTFEIHPEWWDLLCDLPSGRMRISSRIEEAPVSEGLLFFKQQHAGFASLVNTPLLTSTSSANSDLTGDNAFMVEIQKSIHARLGERVIRAKWRDWVVKFTRIAAAFEETVYGSSALNMWGGGGPGSVEDWEGAGAGAGAGAGTPASPPAAAATAAITVANGHGYMWPDENAKMRELAGNVTRIEGWRSSRSHFSFIQDMAKLYGVRRPLQGLDLHHLHDRLRTQRLTPAQSREIYLTLAERVHSYDAICFLLSVASEAQGGLFYVALGLFHKDRDVRHKTAELLERLGAHEAGRHWVRGLSRFEKLALVRVRREAEAELRSKLEKEGQAAPDGVAGGTAGGAAAASLATVAVPSTMASSTTAFFLGNLAERRRAS